MVMERRPVGSRAARATAHVVRRPFLSIGRASGSLKHARSSVPSSGNGVVHLIVPLHLLIDYGNRLVSTNPPLDLSADRFISGDAAQKSGVLTMSEKRTDLISRARKKPMNG